MTPKYFQNWIMVLIWILIAEDLFMWTNSVFYSSRKVIFDTVTKVVAVACLYLYHIFKFIKSTIRFTSGRRYQLLAS